MASAKHSHTHGKINSLLCKGSLHEAFKLLRSGAAEAGMPDVTDRIEKLEETYRYMIHYLVEGFDDKTREEMLSGIINDLHTINDTILRKNIIAESPDAYSSAKRLEAMRKSSFDSLLQSYMDAYSHAALAAETDARNEYQKDADEALSALFSYVWTMYGAPQREYSKLSGAVISSELPFSFQSQMISALMLGNLAYYDRNGLCALLDIYEAEINQKITARSLVAILIVVAANSEMVKKDSRLKARLTLWQDSIISYRRLREVLMNLIRTRDTERISSKMQNEVLPELMKLQPEILKKLKNVSEESDLEMLDINPEWEEILDKNGLGDKLKELTDMQMEGGDVMMVAFSNLKSFPFFNNVSNWFLPFSSNHHEILSKCGDFGPFASLLDMEGVMCDSDKYSFAFSLSQMPESQRKMMTARMDEQMAQLKEVISERKLKSSLPEFDGEVTRYTRDIYRFFKLFRRKDDFKDPFRNPLDFRALPFINEILSDIEIVNLVGEFYFKRGYYAEALPMLMIMTEANPDDYLLWEKIGYCHNALDNLKEAAAWYKKAELMNPGSLWLLKKLALVHKMLGKYDDAAEYYAKALELEPDNYSLLMSAGHSLLESGNTTEATANYYHADYVKPDQPSTLRALGWCEMLNGNLDKSLSLYTKLTSTGISTPNDYLNAGHVHYLHGDLKNAVDLYKRFAASEGCGIDKLEKSIHEDLAVIENAGGKACELNLIIDKIKYDLGNS